ncbi:putative duf4419 domain-containing protein [Rosellinia necatrix]|uniref:Putative duf4419 domain-containing protein n=1 Tax=Rosellinia necatrix TaxID=77044 RepID=A0A1W2TSI9_ROSNE|nr:putative duf4419 domain-containing protein [Rosellinia necatrix]
MPVTVRPASHPPRKWQGCAATSAQALFQASCHNDANRSKRIIQSSFGHVTEAAGIGASSNAFVHAAVSAYNQHHHLTIRPEDVWFSILTQLSFYINANAEELRSLFVAHEGQKELEVVDIGTVQSADFGELAVQMAKEIEKNVLDPELRDWIMPDFTTTTQTDTITAAVLMMGSMQKYFGYKMSLLCGIPSVTLLGEKGDWVDIRQRLARLPQFGKEAETFSRLLVPVLDFFVRTFDGGDDPEVVEFWSKIADSKNNGSGPTYLSGWITAFCFWDAGGKSMYSSPATGCEMNGTQYHKLDTDDIPDGYVSVPVTLDDNGQIIKTRMVAGSVGIAASSSGDKLDTSWTHAGWYKPPFGERQYTPVTPEVSETAGLDSLQPVSGWWMYEVTD